MSETPAAYQAARRSVADRSVVEALHDINQAISVLIIEFVDPVDKAFLRDALQLLLDVAIEHDQMGGYDIYPALGEEEHA